MIRDLWLIIGYVHYRDTHEVHERGIITSASRSSNPE